MFVEISRLLIVLACTLTGLALGRHLGVGNMGGILGTLLGYVGGGILGRSIERAFGLVEDTVDSVPAPRMLAGALGALVGGLGGVFAAAPVVLLFPSAPVVLLGSLVVWICGALGVRLAARKTEEFFALIGLSTRPLVRSRPYEVGDGHIVDTSAIMDGHLGGLVQAGFLDQDLFVPRFVLDELQGFADAREGEQSRRARRGLELLDSLRLEGPVRVRVLDDEVPEHDEVDAKLVTLARRLEIRMLTCDVNLQRVGELQGVSVVNLRKLADDLRPDHVPGDVVHIELVRPGREPGQAVGYLDDGSMVVINDAAEHVGRGMFAVEISTAVPTSVGRLYFARLADELRVESDDDTADPQRAPNGAP